MRGSSEVLVGFAAGALAAVGVPPAAAATTARRLVEADARGRTGHGLIRLPSYVGRIQAGGLNPAAEVTRHHETPVSALVDGGNGLGHVAVTAATELAIAKAGDYGMAWVGTVHSNHAGAAGLYVEMAARRGLVGVYTAVANSNGMPPWGGVAPLLVLRPDLFRPREVVIAELTRHLDALRASGTADGRPVRLPGDEAARRLAESERLGVELADHVAADLDALARDLGLPDHQLLTVGR
jgi:LDH2 family malate/lactate/ureidoglycolate dehydrogenase